MVSVQLLERMVSLRRYVDLVLAGELPDRPRRLDRAARPDAERAVAGTGPGDDERRPGRGLPAGIGARVHRPLPRGFRGSEPQVA